MAFDKPKYLDSAIDAMQQLLKVHVNSNDKLVRNSLNGKASTLDAELEDYAWMITAVIKLYDATSDKKWLNQAAKFIKQSEKLFYDKDQGGFFDNIPEKGIPNTSRIKHSEDGAVVSANGQLLIALARYYRRTGNVYSDELFTQSLAAASGQIAKNPLSHTSMLRAKEIYDKGENSNLAYTGNGHVRISTRRKGNGIIIQFNIDKDWHINSHKTSIESLIPLSIESNRVLKFTYPQAHIRKLDFNDNDLSTFEGEFKVTNHYSKTAEFPLQLNIKLQTCSNKICLAPSTVRLKVY